MASGLAGGDLDGYASQLSRSENNYHFFFFDRDLFDIYVDNPGLLPPSVQTPAEYPEVMQLDIGRPSTITDVCDFIIQYLENDVVVSIALSLTVVVF